MKIDRFMDLGQLAERMGTEATQEDARIMCEFLIVGTYASTEEVPEAEWAELLERVAEAQESRQ